MRRTLLAASVLVVTGACQAFAQVADRGRQLTGRELQALLKDGAIMRSVPCVPGESFLQEDDGQSLAATHGVHLRTRFVVTKNGSAITLRAKTSGDGFPEFARQRFVVVIHDGTGDEQRVTIDNNGTGFSLDLAAL